VWLLRLSRFTPVLPVNDLSSCDDEEMRAFSLRCPRGGLGSRELIREAAQKAE